MRVNLPVLGQVRVRASAVQAERLLTWAKSWPERTWAVEGAGGLGHLLAQELVAAGVQVLDVQPKLAARVRLLASGAVNNNDPNDARSVAITALRSPSCLPVRPDKHAATPNASSSAKPLPDLPPPYDPGPRRPPHAPEKRPPEPLDTKRHRYARARGGYRPTS